MKPRRKVARKARALTDELGLTTPRAVKHRKTTKPRKIRKLV